MPDDARRYLLPPHDAFWQWREWGEVIAWADEKTIGFRPEVLCVLRRLAPGGLPPLGAVVLLLAATRDNWPRLSLEPGILAGMLRTLGEGHVHDALLVEVLAGLDRVHYLDPDLRRPLPAKAVLAEVVFEGLSDRTSPSLASDVVRLLEEGLGEEAATRGSGRHWNHGPSELVRELRLLSVGLKRVDPDVLALRLKTGLDEAPRAAGVELPLPERVRALLRELEQDDEYGGLARLARSLMAAVTLPRSVGDFEELPVGGVSDIVNRGPLERLLLSELAHDDLTLAVRVALNEALYYRREAPPRAPMRHRAVLVEAGIRSWGVPRVFATAVALALAATTDAHTEITVYRAKGDRIEPVDLSTRETLVAHLEALEPDLHPGLALGAFRAAIGQGATVPEPVLVTTDDAAGDADFQQALAASELAPLCVAAVDREGHFRLLERTLRGTRVVREAKLDLEPLFAKPKRPAPGLVDRDRPDDLPAILAVDPFPLLLSHEFDPCRSWRIEGDRVLSLTNDRRLMLWTSRDRGARQISDRVPDGMLWWFSRRPVEGAYRALVGNYGPSGTYLLSIEVDRPRCGATRVEFDPCYAVCSHGGVLFGLSGDRATAISLTGGEHVGRLHIPSNLTWISDRFFRCQGFKGGPWYALSFDGRAPRLERVFPEVVEDSRVEITAVFEREGVDGTIGVTSRGDLVSSVTGRVRKVRHGLSRTVQVLETSHDGRKIVLGTDSSGSFLSSKRCIVDVDTLAVTPCPGVGFALAPSFRDVVKVATYRRRFSHVAVGRGGLLTLFTHKGRSLGIVWDETTRQWRLRENRDSDGGPAEKRPLVDMRLPREVGFRMKVATWNDGSRAFLDSRGLLHLKSSDRSLPETTVVLNDRELAVWCSDGRRWGPAYYLGSEGTDERRWIHETAIRHFVEAVR